MKSRLIIAIAGLIGFLITAAGGMWALAHDDTELLLFYILMLLAAEFFSPKPKK